MRFRVAAPTWNSGAGHTGDVRQRKIRRREERMDVYPDAA
jgi:hypothetical protein